MDKEEILFKLSLLEQQSQEIKQQVEIVDSQISEMENLKLSLNKLEKSKEKEILAPLGRGIFAKSELKSDKIFVNIGSRILVKKSFIEAAEIIEKQVNELNGIKDELLKRAEEINSNLYELIQESEVK